MIPVPVPIQGSSLFQSLESTNTKFTNLYIPASNTIDINYINVDTVNIWKPLGSFVNFISNNQLHNIQDPINNYDLANKHYIDNKVIIPNGPNGSLQINNNGSFFGSSTMIFNESSNTLNVDNIICTNLYTQNLASNGVNGGIRATSSANYTLTLPTNLGSSNQLLTNDSNGNLYWSNNDTPGGIGNQVQYNLGGSFAGSSNLTVSINPSGIDLNTSDIITTTFTTTKLTSNYIELEDPTSSLITTLKTSATTNYSMRFSGDQLVSSDQLTQVLGIDTSGNVISVKVIDPASSSSNSIIYNNNHSMTQSGDAVYNNDNKTFELNKKLIQSHDNAVIYEDFLLIANSISLVICAGLGYVVNTSSIKIIDILSNTIISTISIIVNALYVVSDLIYAVNTNLVIMNQSGTIVSTTSLNSTNGNSIQVIGNIAYIVSNNSNGGYYWIINVSNVENPLVLNSGSINGFPNNNPTFNVIKSLNNYSYIGCDNEIFSLLLVNNVSNDASNNASLVSSLQLGIVNDLEVFSNIIFCIGTFFNIVNSSDPSNPTVVATLALTGSSIVVNNRYAYISNDISGSIYLINITDLYNPVLISTLTNVNLIGINSLCINDKLYCISANFFNTIGISSNFFKTSLVGTLQTNNTIISDIVSNNLSCSNNITTNSVLADKISLFNSNTIDITWTTNYMSYTIMNKYVSANSIIIPEISYIDTQFGFPQVGVHDVENGQFQIVLGNIHSTQEIPIGSLIRVSYIAL